MGTMGRMRRALLLVTLVLAAGGCGGGASDEPQGADGGGGEATTTAAAPPQTTLTVEAPDETATPVAKPSGKPAFTITLSGEGHSARVGTPWHYTVTARRGAKPSGGTAKMRVFLGDQLVDTIGFFAFTGSLNRTHKWPTVLRGKKVLLQAEVEGDGGTQRANWPVSIG